MKKPMVVTDDTLHAALEKYPAFVVDMWAEWCYPCRAVAPIVEQLADEYQGKVAFGKLNVDENPRTAEAYEVMAIPTFLIFKNGRLTGRIVGAASKASLKARIDGSLS